MKIDEHLLVVLGEECAEVAQRVSKALRFGLQETQREQTLTNEQRIVYELNDLIAVVELLRQRDLLSGFLDGTAIEEKKLKIRRYMEYAREQGTLE